MKNLNFLGFLFCFFCLLFCIIPFNTIVAQGKFQKIFGWLNSEGGQSEDRAFSLALTSDSGYVIAGRTSSFGAGGTDVYVIRLDKNGDTLWTKAYGSSANEIATDIIQTSDGGFMVSGLSDTMGSGDQDMLLLRLESTGVLTWSRTLGNTYYDGARRVRETSDNGFVVVGSSAVNAADNYDIYLAKLDATGSLLWTKTYGDSTRTELGKSFAIANDGGYIITGSTQNQGWGNPSNIYVIRTNLSGDTTWTRSYGGMQSDVGHDVKETSDGGIIIVGETFSYGIGRRNVLLIKLDDVGDTLWSSTYGGPRGQGGGYNGDYSECYSVEETSDGGFIIAGEMAGLGPSGNNYYIIRTDPYGDTLWTKIYGGSGEDNARSLKIAPDGGFIIGGITQSFGAGSYDIMVIKTDENGNSSECFSWSSASVITSTVLILSHAPANVGTGGLINFPTIVTSNTNTELNDFSIRIDVYIIPSNWINGGDAMAVVTGGVQPYSYLWSDPKTQTTQIATDLAPGEYTVTVTDASGCLSVQDFVILETGISDAVPQNQMSLYPNPTNGKIDIELTLPDNIDNGLLKVYSNDGLAVYENRLKNIQHPSWTYQLDLTPFAKGIYIIHLVTDKISLIRKAVYY